MFTKPIRALLGLLGILRVEKKWTTANNADFNANREPAELVLVGPGDSRFSQGIAFSQANDAQGDPGGFWSHLCIHVGEYWARRMRQLLPEILKQRKIEPITGRDLGQAIPDEPAEFEIIEAEGGGVQVDTLNKYNGAQLVGFARPLTDAQIEKLLLWYYQQVGKPYGFVTFLTELFPNPSDIPVNDPGYICSALGCTGYKMQLGIDACDPKIDCRKATPQQTYNWLEQLILWVRHFLNCEMGD